MEKGEHEQGDSEVANVCVAVRCRPMSAKELGEGASSVAEFPGPQQVVVTHKGEKNSYAFDHAFGPTTSQDHVFDMLGVPLLDKVFGGFNCTIFAYGQTGSGKTHTMMNHRGTAAERGLIPRINAGIYSRISAHTQEHSTRRFLVCCSFLEIYNEVIYDLLVPRSKAPTKGGGLEIREQKGIGVYVKDLTEMVIDGADKLDKLIEQGFEHRSTAATKMNDASSRSHCIFMIKLHQKDAEDESKNTFSNVNLVDLAGSERAKSTEAEGDRLKEGANINKSLSALGNVINALSSMGGSGKKVFVPYRNSKLTRVLQESLGGNSLCTMVAAMSPSGTNSEETLSTLNYARRAKSIKLSASKNEESSQLRKLEDEVQALKAKLEQQTLAAGQASMGSKEKQEMEAKYEKQIDELQSFMKQSWEDKQQLSVQYEEEQRKAREETKRAAERIKNEQKRRLQLLEQKGDIELSLQALAGLNSKLCVEWPDRITDGLKAEQQLRAQLHAVKLFRESAGADFFMWWGRRDSEAVAALTLLGQVHTKLGSMAKELETLAKLEVHMEHEMGQIAPKVGLALREAQGENQSDGDQELVQLLALVQKQLAQHQGKAREFMRTQRRQLGFKDELRWLAQCLEEDGAGPTDERTGLIKALQGEAMAAEAKTPRAAEGVESGSAVQHPSLLGLSTLEWPDDRISASSNATSAKCARLQQAIAFGGWCPTQDSREEYLEVDLGMERRVTSVSLQGRMPCTGEWSQTRDLLRMVLDPNESLPSKDKLPSAEKFYRRPPVRLVHDIGVALACHQGCFQTTSTAGWEIPEDLLTYSDLSREQKVSFFEKLIERTNQACDPEAKEGIALSITSQDILSGKNCDEANRLLQLLSYLALASKRPPEDHGGLSRVAPQWTTAWRLAYFTEADGWCWYGVSVEGGGAEQAMAFEGNIDAIGTKVVDIPEPFVASKLRVHPISWHNHVAFRCELHVASKDAVLALKAGDAGNTSESCMGLEACVALVCKGIVEVKSAIQARQAAQQQEEDAKAAEVSAAKNKAEQECDRLERRLKDALARLEELETLHTAETQRAVTAETSLLQMTVERDRLNAKSDQLESELHERSEGKAKVEDELSRRQEECAEVKSALEDITDQLQVMTEERDLARTKEEELFDQLTGKEEELMDTNNGYVYLTERLHDKEDELENLDEQVRNLQEQNDALATQCGERAEEVMQVRLECQQLKAKLSEEERMHKAAQERYVQVLKDRIEDVPVGGTTPAAVPTSSNAKDPVYEDDFDE